MNLIRSIAVSHAMVVIAVIGFIGITAYAGLGFKADLTFNKSLHEDERLIELATSVGPLTHELQKERGASAGFLASKGTKFGDTLKQQRKVSDEKIATFREAVEVAEATVELGPELILHIDEVLHELDELVEMRVQIDTQTIDRAAAVQAITKANHDAIKLLPEIGKYIFDSETSRAVQRHAIFLTAKDILGLERATGAAGFTLAHAGDETFPPAIYAQFETLEEEKKVLLGLYRALASDHILPLLDDLDLARSSSSGNM